MRTHGTHAIMKMLACVLLAAHTHSRGGESETPKLPDVTITAPRPAEPPAPPAPPTPPRIAPEIRRVAGGASIVAVEKLVEGKTESFKDLLRGSPGVYVQSNSGGENVKISIRGSGIQSEDVIGIAFLLDGLPYNEGDGETLLEDYDLQAVKAAEVYRGANALRYGSATLGGAVNLIAKTGCDADRVAGRFEAGSFGYFQEAINFGGVYGSTDYFVALKDVRSDGYRIHSAENSQKFFADVGQQISGNLSNRVYVSGGRLDREVPGSLTREQLRANPRRPAEDAIEQDFHLHWENARIADKAVYKCGDDTFSLGAFYQYRILTEKQFYDVDEPEGILRFHSNDMGAAFNYDDLADLCGRRNRLTLGMLPTLEFEGDASYENLDGRQGPKINGAYTTAFNLPVYGEDQFWLTDKLSIVGGLQLAYIRRDFDDLFRPAGVPNQSHVQDFFGVSPKIGAIYDWSEAVQLYGNFSRSFQPPSFDDLAAVQEDSDAGVIYRKLRPQRGNTIEIGGRGETSRLNWEVSLYRTWLQHELLALNSGAGISVGTINADQTVHQGIEAGLDVDLFRGIATRCGCGEKDRISLLQSYTFSDYRFSNDRLFGDNRIAGIPVHLYYAGLDYKHPTGFYAGAGVECNISKYPADHANTLYAEPYTLLDFRAGYRSTHGFSIFFQATNLTNKAHTASVQPISDARAGESAVFNPGNGRAFYGGFSFKW